MNDVLRVENVFIDLPQRNKEELFKYLIDNETSGAVSNSHQVLTDVLAREADLSTGFVKGIAIPHGISNGVEHAIVLIGKLNEPILWETIDGDPVNLVFLILSPKDSKEQSHLKILAKVAGQLADEDIIEQIIMTNSKEQIINLLKEEV